MLELVQTIQSKSPDLEKQKILDYIRITNEFLFTNLRKVAISHKDLDD